MEGGRTRGNRACSWLRFDVKVEVDERVKFLERERLCRLVVDEHTFPFFRRLLLALEYYHLVVLDRAANNQHVRGGRNEVGGVGGNER